MSLAARSASRSAVHPGSPVSWRVWCSTSMPKPLARRATACPMRPKPTTPSVAPCTSRPRYWLMPQPGQRPARRSASAVGREPGRGEDQQEGEVGRGLVEHARRVAHRDAGRARPRRRRCCRSRPRRWRRPGAGRAPASSTAASMRSVSRHTIASTSAPRRTSSSCVYGVSSSRATSSCPAASERIGAAVGQPTGDEDARQGAVSARCSRPAPASCTPTAKQKQWIGAWSLTGRRLCTEVGRDVHEVALRDLALLAVDRHDPAAGR